MARAAQRERNDSNTASRIAARRRETTSERKAPKGAKPGKSAKAGRGARPSSVGRIFKLGVLIAAFLCIGFFVVLVLDVGASLVGSVKLGQDITVAALWEKVIARVLDEDVPRPPAEKPHAVPPAKPRARAAAPIADRAPVEAARPEEDAQHVDTRTDPEVERAKKRLDEILGRL